MRRRAFPSALLALLAAAPAHAGNTVPVLRVESNAAGEIELQARQARVVDVLRAVAAEGDFDVLIQDGIIRPPVNASLRMKSIDDVLRAVLRGRNHALVYDRDAELSRVIVLTPSTPRRPGAVSRPPRRVQPRRQAIVVSR
jgi:hypothetical protein